MHAWDLQALEWQNIKNKHESVMEINAWAQEHLKKSLFENPVQCKFKLFHIK